MCLLFDLLWGESLNSEDFKAEAEPQKPMGSEFSIDCWPINYPRCSFSPGAQVGSPARFFGPRQRVGQMQEANVNAIYFCFV